MYENLMFGDNYPTPGELSDDDLQPAYFKDQAMLRESTFDAPRSVSDGTRNARIGRDDFGVPHIFGDTRPDVMFGSGSATATDRVSLIEVVRRTTPRSSPQPPPASTQSQSRWRFSAQLSLATTTRSARLSLPAAMMR